MQKNETSFSWIHFSCRYYESFAIIDVKWVASIFYDNGGNIGICLVGVGISCSRPLYLVIFPFGCPWSIGCWIYCLCFFLISGINLYTLFGYRSRGIIIKCPNHRTLLRSILCCTVSVASLWYMYVGVVTLRYISTVFILRLLDPTMNCRMIWSYYIELK